MTSERCSGSRQFIDEETIEIVEWRATVACPDCFKKVYPQLRARNLKDKRSKRVRVGNHR